MRHDDDPVDAVILAFLDHLEGVAGRPTLDHLSDADRGRAQLILDGLVTARGMDPRASRPSVESLVSDTPLAALAPALRTAPVGPADVAQVRRVLAEVDHRAQVHLDDGPPVPTVVYSYLDLRARFLLVAAATPVITEPVRAQVEALFAHDPDTSRIGVVAARGAELVTQMLSAEDVGDTVLTPRGELHLRWEPPLPLALAARRMQEYSAPEWPAFDFVHGHGEALDLGSLAAEAARQIIERESARAYRGEKRRAYQALVGHERIFADLVATVSRHATDVDLDAETTRMCVAVP